MKNFKLFSLAILATLSTNIFSQTEIQTIDIGYDWDPVTPITVKATSGNIFDTETMTYTYNQGAVSEINFIVGGGATISALASNQVYTNTNTSVQVPEPFSYINLSNGVDVQYFEGNVGEDCNFVSLKLNGVSSSTTTNTDVAVVYSDKTPFDVTSVIGYTEAPFAMLRAGGNAAEINSIPVEAKSFRLYSRARILPYLEDETETGKYYLYASGVPEGVTVGTPVQVGYSNSNQTRLAYVSVTYQYEDNTTSIENTATNNNKIAISKTYYDLSGRLVSEAGAKGVFVQKTVFEDGTISFEKVYKK